jgi:hypothetical protein
MFEKEYTVIEKKVVNGFLNLMNEGYPAKDAILTLDYWIFVKFSNEFHQLTEEEQSQVRYLLHSMKLVHV